MFKKIFTICLLLGSISFNFADIGGDGLTRVAEIYIPNPTTTTTATEFWVRFYIGGNWDATWYRVVLGHDNASLINSAKYNLLYSQLLTSLNSKNLVWIGEHTHGTGSNTVHFITQATIYAPNY